MKKLLVISAAVLMSTAAMAQTVRSYKSTATDGNGLVYTLPRTSLVVNVITQRESVRKGPYARFAQKYFGTLAPLADKDVYSIVGAKINAFEEADPSQVYVLSNSEKSPVDLYRGSSEGVIALGIDGQGSAPDLFASKDKECKYKCLESEYSEQDTSFMRVPISRTEMLQSSIEEQAAVAAEALFSLRRRRIELITGDQGEYVFGAGLGDALKEIDRLEKEYIALFFGKTYTKTIVKSYNVVPESGKNTIIVCRFAETVGTMPTSDLSGTPIVLELTPENKARASVLPTAGTKDDKVYVRVADVVLCRLVDSNKTIMQERVPIYQFGQVVQAPISAIK